MRHDHGDGTATSLCSGSVAGARMGSGFCTGTFGSAAVCATASTSGSSTSAATRRSILNSSPSADAAGGATAPGAGTADGPARWRRLKVRVQRSLARHHCKGSKRRNLEIEKKETYPVLQL